MIFNICLLCLLLLIVIIYLFFNRSTLIPIESTLYSNIDVDNTITIPIHKQS